MVIFKLDQVPNGARRGRAAATLSVTASLSDLKTFKAQDGLAWLDSAGRAFSLTMKELVDCVATAPSGTSGA